MKLNILHVSDLSFSTIRFNLMVPMDKAFLGPLALATSNSNQWRNFDFTQQNVSSMLISHGW